MTARNLALALAALSAAGPSPLGSSEGSREVDRAPRPNILWITCEDMGPHLGAYGDPYATTPNLDRLARKGMIYLRVWSNAPVCAPARTAIISGLYPPATGSEHMRSLVRLPEGMKMYPQYLREAGYHSTNNAKEDYNLEKPGKVWDASSSRAHWKDRAPGQPFFAIFNHTATHESQVRARPHALVHDPARARVPAYHPDVSEVRRDWAQYYDKISEMDALAGKNLQEIEEAGLAEDTIVFFFSDHGPGLPRSKRFPGNSGLRVPLIVYVPEKHRGLAGPDYVPGGRSERLVSFVDLAPTVLSLAGIRPPPHLHGRAFLGPYAAPPPPYLHGFRGRMDERADLSRSVFDGRYVYVRNYMPHRIYGEHVAYMFETPTTQVWKRLYDEGKLAPPRTYFWEPKPPEELYDLESDPDEVRNLAGSPEHRGVLERLREANRRFILSVRDLGFLPEGEIHERSRGRTPYELGQDPERHPLERILRAAELASPVGSASSGGSGGRGAPEDALRALEASLADEDGAVRYWGAMGFLARGREATERGAPAPRRALADASPYVRIAAAEALGRFGRAGDRAAATRTLLELASPADRGIYVALFALDALDHLGPAAPEVAARVRELPDEAPDAPERVRGNLAKLKAKILAGAAGSSVPAGPAGPSRGP